MKKQSANAVSALDEGLFDPLRVFVEFDTQYEIWVARCLQTGHLVTANNPDKAKEMITELLQDEISFAVSSGDFSQLLSNPEPLETWIKWKMAWAVNPDDERKIKVSGDVPKEIKVLLGQSEVETLVRIATGSSKRTAA